MTQRHVVLAVEDVLGEAVGKRILGRVGITISQELGFKGKGYLQQKAQNLNQAAKGIDVFMLADQDSGDACPPEMIRTWIKGPRHPRFSLRFAVMEVQSWIMADQKGIAGFLSVPLSRVPVDTDALSHPKEFLVSLARRSNKRRLRAELIPRPGATSKVGPGYNLRLEEFVRLHWDIDRAGEVSRSLQRALRHLGIAFPRPAKPGSGNVQSRVGNSPSQTACPTEEYGGGA